MIHDALDVCAYDIRVNNSRANFRCLSDIRYFFVPKRLGRSRHKQNLTTSWDTWTQPHSTTFNFQPWLTLPFFFHLLHVRFKESFLLLPLPRKRNLYQRGIPDMLLLLHVCRPSNSMRLLRKFWKLLQVYLFLTNHRRETIHFMHGKWQTIRFRRLSGWFEDCQRKSTTQSWINCIPLTRRQIQHNALSKCRIWWERWKKKESFIWILGRRCGHS